MAEPIATLTKATLNLATNIGGRESDGSKKPMLIGIFTVLLFFIFLLCACVYILLAPARLFFGNDAIQNFKNKYGGAVIRYAETEQIGIYPMPCGTTAISSDYGYRGNPTGAGGETHTGIDFATAWHSQVVAITEGTVVKTGTDKFYGRYILIRHEEFYSFYAHLSRNYVIRGQEVTAFQVIGKEGGDPELDPSPGRSTGHHLHFEIRTNQFAWSHVDPYEYILEPPEPPEEETEETEKDSDTEKNL